MDARTFLMLLFVILCEFRCLFSSSISGTEKYFTNTYAVHIEGGPDEAVRVARDLGFTYLGEVSIIK